MANKRLHSPFNCGLNQRVINLLIMDSLLTHGSAKDISYDFFVAYEHKCIKYPSKIKHSWLHPAVNGIYLVKKKS